MQSAPGDRVAALSVVPLFAWLSANEIESLASKAAVQGYRAGEVVFLKDDPGYIFHLILDGLVKVYVTSDDSQEAMLVLLKAGGFFGELFLFDGAPSSANAAAIEPTETFTIYRDDFLDFIREHPDAALNIFSAVASRLRRADGIIADAAFLDLPARIAKKLMELAQNFGHRKGNSIEIDFRLRQQDVAGMVNATRASVNRNLAGMKEEGIIQIDRQKITILRPDLLLARVH